MSGRPTLKLPAKPRPEKTRSGTVRPTAAKPRRLEKPPEAPAKRRPMPPAAEPATRGPRPDRRTPTPSATPDTVPAARDTLAPGKKDRPGSRMERTSQPPHLGEDRLARRSGMAGRRAPSGAPSGDARAPSRATAGRRERGAAGAAHAVSNGPRPAPPTAPRRPMSPELPRLSKRMSELGLCSRREADEWIDNGWVRVDGTLAKLGMRVHPNAKIEVERIARLHQTETVTILLHKPFGYVSGQAESGHEPAMVLIRPENRWDADKLPTAFKRAHLRGLAPAGRLDIDSTGLLVFTQDGRIAKRLVGDDIRVEKEYLVRVEGKLIENGLTLLGHGLELDGRKLKPAHVSWQNEHQLRFVLREGRKRQIRRMCELVGLRVTGLKRVRIGSVTLAKLPVGKWRYLRPDEAF